MLYALIDAVCELLSLPTAPHNPAGSSKPNTVSKSRGD
jgi:hypothetical protein